MKFGKYSVERKLGKGAMGEVYYGVHPNLDIPIAIKTLSRQFVEDKQFIERFVREAKMAARLRHENAVMIYDADHDEENHFIVMEFVAGGNLTELIEKEGKIEESQALKIIRAVASALQAAAKFNIIHRDIKPDNIMLGEDGTPKLADLGVARQNVEGSVNTTMTGVIVGTPNYLAPEQAKGSKDIDARADIYALGCTFYKMLSGECPYSGQSAFSVMMKHVNDPIPDIRQQVPEISAGTAELLLAMMAKTPEDRPQSATALIEWIDRIEVLNKNLSSAKEIVSTANKPSEEGIYVSKKRYGILLSLVLVIAVLLISLFVSKEDNEPDALTNKPPQVQENSTDNITKADKIEKTGLQPFDIMGMDIRMLPVKAGSFQMGAGLGEPTTQAVETLHTVSLTEDFYLSRLEISVANYRVFAESTNYRTAAENRGWSSFHNPNGQWTERYNGLNWRNIDVEDDNPISMITRDDALEFCRWLTERERVAGRLLAGYVYTLPTEAQWEYACRAGSQTPFANNMEYHELAWAKENSNRKVQKRGLKKPNAWGFYDMHGNVWEFCLDLSTGQTFFDVRNDQYQNNMVNPLSTQGERVIYRGGSFPDPALQACRSASRGHSLPSYSANNHGFRLCLSKVR